MERWGREQLPDTSVSITSDVNAGLTGQEESQAERILGPVAFPTLDMQIFRSACRRKRRHGNRSSQAALGVFVFFI